MASQGDRRDQEALALLTVLVITFLWRFLLLGEVLLPLDIL